MQTYVRGHQLPPQHQSGLSKYALGKYYPVNTEGVPNGQPFDRKYQIELYHRATGTPYQIVTGKVGKPRKHKPGEADRLQNARPERKVAKAKWARENRAKKKSQNTLDTP
jgi:hypothetical protein